MCPQALFHMCISSTVTAAVGAGTLGVAHGLIIPASEYDEDWGREGKDALEWMNLPAARRGSISPLPTPTSPSHMPCTYALPLFFPLHCPRSPFRSSHRPPLHTPDTSSPPIPCISRVFVLRTLSGLVSLYQVSLPSGGSRHHRAKRDSLEASGQEGAIPAQTGCMDACMSRAVVRHNLSYSRPTPPPEGVRGGPLRPPDAHTGVSSHD